MSEQEREKERERKRERKRERGGEREKGTLKYLPSEVYQHIDKKRERYNAALKKKAE